jgi:uncharacterized protein (DUF2267 family)
VDEIVKQVAAKANITEEQAQVAVDLVVDVLKEKLPAPVAGQIDGLLSGEGAEGIAGQLGGLLGKK